MTRTKVAKLLYLVDLESVRLMGQEATDLQWRWLHHGPFDKEYFQVEDRLIGRGLVQRTTAQNYYGSPEFRLSLAIEDADVGMDARIREIVDEVVARFGGLAASTLRDLTYQTAPMLAALQGNHRGVELDLDRARPVPNAAPALARLREVLASLPPQETDKEALDEIAETLKAFGRPRAEATREMLD